MEKIFWMSQAFSDEAWFCLPPAFTLVSCLAYPSIIKMEATCSAETAVDFQRTTRRYISEDRTLQGWFDLSGHVNFQNSRLWSAFNCMGFEDATA
jgi:hypothetical protein